MGITGWTLLDIGIIMLFLAAAVIIRKLVILALSLLPVKRLLGEHTTKVFLFFY